VRPEKRLGQWAASERVRGLLTEIERVPCYYWPLCLLKHVKPKSLNRYLAK